MSQAETRVMPQRPSQAPAPLQPLTVPVPEKTGTGKGLEGADDVDVTPTASERESVSDLSPRTIKKTGTGWSSATRVESNSTTLREPGQHRPLAVKLWGWEIAAYGVSLASLTVIIAVLSAYDGKGLPSLPLQVTLNTFLAYFTTLTKAAFMVPVGKALSQWKWNWFIEDRPLSDFTVFDDASRGIWGSVLLLKRLRLWHMANLGALISIMGIATSTMTQQLISYPQRLSAAAPGANATTRAIHRYALDSRTSRNRAGESAFLAAVVNGFAAPAVDPLEPLITTCTSLSCTYDEFETLGVCAKVGNVTSHLRVAELHGFDDWNLEITAADRDGWNVSLAGCAWTTGGPGLVKDCALPANVSLAFPDDADLAASRVYSVAFVYSLLYGDMTGRYIVDEADDVPPDAVFHPVFQALEVSWHLCARRYRVRFDHGAARSELLSTRYDVDHALSAPLANNLSCVTPTHVTAGQCDMPLWDRNTSPGSRPLVLAAAATANGGAGGPDDDAPRLESDYFALEQLGGLLFMECTTWWSMNPLSDYAWGGQNTVSSNTMMKALISSGLDTAVHMSNVQRIADNIGTSLTNALRLSSGSFAIDGTGWREETYVHIQWEWAVFLLVQMALTLLFLVITMVSTSRVGMEVLKDSAIAMLVALSRPTRAVVGPIDSDSAMNRKAAVLRGRLVENEVMLCGPAAAAVLDAGQDTMLGGEEKGNQMSHKEKERGGLDM